jgi:hypothetical protein
MPKEPEEPEATSTARDGDERIRVIHLLGHPSLPLDLARSPGDAQVFNCHNFCLLLEKAGIDYVYYGLPGSIVTPRGRVESVGTPTQAWHYRNAWHRDYTRRLDERLRTVAAPLDGVPQLVASLYGCAQADIGVPDALDLPVFEPMVGYDHCWSDYRVFPSYAQQTVMYTDPDDRVQDSVWFDTVIPHFVESGNYWIAEKPGDYALFLGRDAPDKGWQVAEEFCARAGVPLRRGHSGYSGEAKTQLIAEARVVLMPTLYLEPFGYVAVEAQMCGVPVLTTDWGAFAETVEQGVSGFRCRTHAEFLHALSLVDSLDRQAIRERAVGLYSIEAVLPQYLAYFDFVWQVHRHGGYYADSALRYPFVSGVRQP